MDINEIGTTQSVILYTLTYPKSTKIYFGEKELWNFLLTPLCSNFSLKLMKNWGSAVRQLSWLIERYLNSHEILQKYCTIYTNYKNLKNIFKNCWCQDFLYKIFDLRENSTPYANEVKNVNIQTLAIFRW